MPLKPEKNIVLFSDNIVREILLMLGICLVAAGMMLPLLVKGVPDGNDLPQHFQFAVTIHDSLVEGDLYPAWMENENKGYGGVGMRFYPPVGYYALAIGKMITGSWFWSTFFVFCFWLALSGVGAYLWCRERSGQFASFIGGCVFVIAPYHINEIYNAFNYAEFAAVAFLPFCFLFVDRLCREGKLFNFAGLAVSYALLALSNLPVAVMGTIALGIYSLASLPKKDLVPAGLRLGGAYIFGALLSSFYWLKVVTEMAWLNHSSENYSAGSEHYDYRVNFLLQLKYLVVFDERDMWFANMVLGFTLLLTLPLGFVYWKSVRSFAANRLNRVWITLFFSLFMATYLSVPVWNNISLLQKVQFPWRWLAVISLAGVPLAAAGWDYCREWLKDKRRPYAMIIIGTLAFGFNFTIFQVARQAFFKPADKFERLIATLRDEKNFDCWFTVWAKEEALSNQEKVNAGGRAIENLSWVRKSRNFTVAAGEPATVRLATFYYPYWQVKVNGAPVETRPAADGALQFDIPGGEANVSAAFEEPPLIHAAQILSLLCWIAALLLIGIPVFSLWSADKKSISIPELA
jgi:hypothetical protein